MPGSPAHPADELDPADRHAGPSGHTSKGSQRRHGAMLAGKPNPVDAGNDRRNHIRCGRPEEGVPDRPKTMTGAALHPGRLVLRRVGGERGLGRFSGHPRPVRLSAAALVRLVSAQRVGPVGRDPASARRAVHPRARRVRADGFVDQHDDAWRSRILSARREALTLRRSRSTLIRSVDRITPFSLGEEQW